MAPLLSIINNLCYAFGDVQSVILTMYIDKSIIKIIDY